MFWNATFAHSQSLKYPENLRYIQLFFFSAISLYGHTFKVTTYLLFTFADQFFRSPKTKCHLLCQVGKTQRYDSSHSFFKATLKVLVVNWLGSDRYFFFHGGGWQFSWAQNAFVTFRLCVMFFRGHYTVACTKVFENQTQDLDSRKHLIEFFTMVPLMRFIHQVSPCTICQQFLYF